MKHLRVNDHDIAYIDIGQGPPLVCVHGSIGDFRVWAPVLGPLSRDRRVVALSLRHFFPAHWDGKGGAFTMAQHVSDVIGFLQALKFGPVDLMGHSRGGHITFRVAQQRPDLLRRIVLAEPGGELDASLQPADAPAPAQGMRARTAAAMEKIAAGDIDGGLEPFVDAIDGAGAWARMAPASRQVIRDNARTLLGQVNEQRKPFTRDDAAGIRVPTLFVSGADTPGSLPVVTRALVAHLPGARTAVIPRATHWMFENDPQAFCAAVLAFLDAPGG